MYVYQFHHNISKYQVGFYPPNGNFISESKWDTAAEASARVSYLNGGIFFGTLSELKQINKVANLMIIHKNIVWAIDDTPPNMTGEDAPPRTFTDKHSGIKVDIPDGSIVDWGGADRDSA